MTDKQNLINLWEMFLMNKPLGLTEHGNTVWKHIDFAKIEEKVKRMASSEIEAERGLSFIAWVIPLLADEGDATRPRKLVFACSRRQLEAFLETLAFESGATAKGFTPKYERGSEEYARMAEMKRVSRLV
jgi:hypothetical protein